MTNFNLPLEEPLAMEEDLRAGISDLAGGTESVMENIDESILELEKDISDLEGVEDDDTDNTDEISNLEVTKNKLKACRVALAVAFQSLKDAQAKLED